LRVGRDLDVVLDLDVDRVRLEVGVVSTGAGAEALRAVVGLRGVGGGAVGTDGSASVEGDDDGGDVYEGGWRRWRKR
jgi:hypothetical protein